VAFSASRYTLNDMSVEDRLNRLYAALVDMNVTERLSSMRWTPRQVEGRSEVSFDFTKGMDPETATNRVHIVVNNIACLKDHLKRFCEENGKAFAGDELIANNQDVAIIHDLWNVEKHGKLDRSRSGHYPRLAENARTAITIRSEGRPASGGVTIPLFGRGSAQVHGDAALRIVATVVDRDGKKIDDFEPIALRAIAAWEAVFVKVGIKLDPSSE
jgi:hypothetical protein